VRTKYFCSLSSLREMFQKHLSVTESLENRHENNEAVNRSCSCFLIRWRGYICVCDRANCVVARWRPHLHCRYFEVQNLVTERTKTGGSSFILKKSEERVDFNHVRSSTGMLTLWRLSDGEPSSCQRYTLQFFFVSSVYYRCFLTLGRKSATSENSAQLHKP
jgi:hypothetical protein